MSKNHIRNVAIIAHVDHGKTTLVDELLSQSDSLERGQKGAVRLMDSNDLEKERGITILAKCTYIDWESYTFNIVDTPGHADFGGEVERILGMVDGVLMLVDAAEGPMPQTKFVLTKALEQGLRPIVIINKIDKPDSRVDEVLDEIFDLFVNLNANEDQLDFPVIYASAKQGWATTDMAVKKDHMHDILDAIKTYIPAPEGNEDKPFQMLATMLAADPYLGRVLTGRIHNGVATLNMPVHAVDMEGNIVERGKLTKIFASKGLEPVTLETAGAGSIVSITGLSEATVSNTISSPDITEALKAIPIDPPTIAMTFAINNSPLAGQSGKKLTSREIRNRLFQEMESNISVKVQESANKEAFEVSGRGELQLGVLIETMRREGFELSISRPRVLFQTDESGKKTEPMEEVKIDVDDEFVGVVVEKVSGRRGEMQDMQPLDGNRTRITFACPSRGLIGFRGELLTDTKGSGILHRSFQGYGPYKGPIEGRRTGSLISNGAGKALSYALWKMEDRGTLFVEHGNILYEGMIIGEHNRENDLVVNALKGKQLTNMRASGKDEGIKLTPPRRFSLEQALSYIEDDDLVEVTPAEIRLRKRYLDPNDRKRNSRGSE